jgi:hypothetical protein
MSACKLLAGLTGTAAIAAAVSLAPPAQAEMGAWITSTVTWTGRDCIGVSYPDVENRYFTDYTTICGGVSRVTYWATVGQYVGADPAMGPASSVSCSLQINGWIDNADSAIAHDGHDANCMRVLAVRSPSYPSYPSYQPPPPPPPPLLRAS